MTAYTTTDPSNHAITDMIIIAFFFLLCPGEYTGMVLDTCPFHLTDVQFWIGSLHSNASTLPLSDLIHITFAMLMFTNQKNGVRSEVIRLGHSGDPLFCPVLALQCRITHLCQHNQPPNTPLATFVQCSRVHLISPPNITTALCASATLLGPSLGFLPSDINARSLQAAGAMALLCVHVDSDVICLLG
jgi:hypothetical protein